MEIDLGFGREGAAIGIAALVALLIGLALLGRAATSSRCGRCHPCRQWHHGQALGVGEADG
jgi:hypothetical protein